MIEYPKREVKRITNFIRRKVKETHAKCLVIGLSGGVDSSLVATLCKLAGQPVIGLIMPTDNNAIEDEIYAGGLAEVLGIRYEKIFIDAPVQLITSYSPGDEISKGNVAARIRMTLLYMYAGNNNGLVVGTDNLTENVLGYFTKYGDGGVDFNPIGHLYKTEVWQLAEYLDIDERVVKRKPTAGLWKGQTDEDEIGVTYEEIDKILSTPPSLRLTLGISQEKINRVANLCKKNLHKRKMPETLKGSVCFQMW